MHLACWWALGRWLTTALPPRESRAPPSRAALWNLGPTGREWWHQAAGLGNGKPKMAGESTEVWMVFDKERWGDVFFSKATWLVYWKTYVCFFCPWVNHETNPFCPFHLPSNGEWICMNAVNIGTIYKLLHSSDKCVWVLVSHHSPFLSCLCPIHPYIYPNIYSMFGKRKNLFIWPLLVHQPLI